MYAYILVTEVSKGVLYAHILVTEVSLVCSHTGN